MKKATYLIRVQNNGNIETESRAGYIFNYAGYSFGVTNYKKYEFMDAPRKVKKWIISELQTGYKLTECARRADSIEAVKNIVDDKSRAAILKNSIAAAVDRFGVINTDL